MDFVLDGGSITLIVLGVVLWLWPDGEEPTQAAPAPATTAEPVTGGESVCGLDAGRWAFASKPRLAGRIALGTAPENAQRGLLPDHRRPIPPASPCSSRRSAD